jgi:hypothetical protein
MIDYIPTLLTELSECSIPCYYEQFINDKSELPCITYREYDNTDLYLGDTLNYSNIGYWIKVWSKKVSDFYTYGQEVDDIMKPLGFKRTFSDVSWKEEIGQFILRYQAIGYEN